MAEPGPRRPLGTVDEHLVAVDGGQLFVRAWQPEADEQRAPIVLFHDSLGCVDLWRDFPAVLGERTGRTVVAYDRLGFGRSDPNPQTLALDFVSTEGPSGLQPVLAELEVERWIGFGHSVGGGMALCAASQVPGCLATVTESAQAFVEQRTIDGIEAARGAFAQPGQLDRLARHHGEKAQWVLDAWIETWLSPGFAGWSLDDALPAIATPILAMHGELDEYGSMAHPERIVALAGGPARAVELTGSWHVPHRDVRPQVLDLVADFVASLD